MEKFFSLVRRSLKSEHHDFTKGDVVEAVILLSVPMILELSLEGVFAIVDMFFVARLGANAIATVGLTEAAITLIYSLAIGLGTGATALVARRVGEKNPNAAASAGFQAIVLSIAVAIGLGIVGAFYASEILSGMGGSPDVVRDGAIFTRILIGGSPAIVLLFVINGVFRGAGDAAIAMRSLWIASGMNIVLCPILIHFFGLKGAAIATLIGRSSGVGYQLMHLKAGKGAIQIARQHCQLVTDVLRSIVKIAWPATLQFLIGSGSWIILTKLVAETGGTAASAGYQIAMRNFVFFILPAWGLSNAAATLVGQNLGAKQPQRAEDSALTTVKVAAWAMGFVIVFFVLLAPLIAGFFTDDPIVFGYALSAMRIIGSGYVFYGVGMVLAQSLNGAGDSTTPTWINFFCFWVFQTPMAFWLAKGTALGSQGVAVAIPLAHVALVLAAGYFFRRGQWKTIKV